MAAQTPLTDRQRTPPAAVEKQGGEAGKTWIDGLHARLETKDVER